MPNEVILFGAAAVAFTAVATLLATLLGRWQASPPPVLRPLVPLRVRIRRILR